MELVVSHITDELVNRGHEVTLFASGDSITNAKLETVIETSIRTNPNIIEPIIYDLLQINQVLEQGDLFDIIHFHTHALPLPFVKFLKTPVVHTLHKTFNQDNHRVFKQYKDQPYISISDAQRQLEPTLNYIGTVYNGILTEKYPFSKAPSDPPYLAFLGRFDDLKNPHEAINIAKKTGLTLKMAGKIQDPQYFKEKVEPHIDGKQIQYLGEVNHEEKVDLLSNAVAMLFPIKWPEPFGLVMVESMCTGTPVIATNFGSVPEVIAHGKTGFICKSIDEMIAAIPEAFKLKRQDCHDHVVNNFSVSKMVDNHEELYKKIIKQK